jgi:monoamine oxidase
MITTRRRWLFGATGALVAACSSPRPREAAPPASRRPIVVVGAGIAGLAVAHGLAACEGDVLVLEAKERPGGRILTIRAPFHEGLYVEAGATHVVPDPDLLALVAASGVEVVPARPRRDLARVVLENGTRTKLAPGEERPSRHAITDEEKKLGWMGCLERYFADAKAADPTVPWPPPDLARHDAVTAEEMLRARGASPGWIAGLGEAFVGERIDQVSGAFMLREMAAFFRDLSLGRRGGRIAGGSDRFPAALAGKLGDRVVYGAEVKRIEHDARSVRVSFVRRGRLDRVEADRVVCALPYTVLRRVAIAPSFSAQKTRAIHELPAVSVTRVFAEVGARFWLERGEAGDVDTDLPIGTLRDETQLQDGPRGAVLGAYLSGDAARASCAHEEGARVRAFVDAADEAMPGVRDRLRAGASKCWDEDPFARGAYAWFRPGQMTSFGCALWSPEGRVHFAGDHLSHRPGFMHGAVASARRVVAEVLEARRGV